MIGRRAILGNWICIQSSPEGTARRVTTTFHTAQGLLFDAAALPPGLAYAAGFVGAEQEAALLELARTLPMRHALYKGYIAQRRVYAWRPADDEERSRKPGGALEELPAPLQQLRSQLAAWAGVAPADFDHVLISEYQPGTPLGWHRDAPHYELIVGVSLGAPARFRLRPWPPEAPKKADIVTLELAPRSAYRLQGSARWGWQHSVAPVPGLRYSVTMRTRRDRHFALQR